MGPSSYSSFSGVNVPRVAMAEFAMGLRDAGENILADKILARSTVATSVFHFRLTSEGNWPSRSTIRPANSPSFTDPCGRARSLREAATQTAARRVRGSAG